MSIFSLVSLASGLSLFLYGMYRSEAALKLLAGSHTKRLIESITRNRFVALVIGLVLTFLTQSSSATTVMLVGFATAGLISLSHSIGVLLGTAIGTTITVQLFAWKVTRFAPLLISVGFLFFAIGRESRRGRFGQLTFGLGLVLFGMEVMADAIEPVRTSGLLHVFLGAVESRIGLLLISAAFTAVVQSSAATIALVIALAVPEAGQDGIAVTIERAVPLVLGANIGTSVTALIASLQSDTKGRQVAWAHTLYKTITALIALPFVGWLAELGRITAPDRLEAQIANVHTMFNVAAALVFLPFAGTLAWVTVKLFPESRETRPEYSVSFIDRDFSAIPYLALSQASKEIVRMSGVATNMLESAWSALEEQSLEDIDTARRLDDRVDFLQERITPYLTKISEREMHHDDSRRQMELFAVASDIELVGDVISKDLCGSIEQLLEKDLAFSKEGMRDLRSFYEQVRVALYSAIEAFTTDNHELAESVTEQKRQINALQEELRLRHFDRLKRGTLESMETTTLHLDIMEDLRRIASHGSRICYWLLSHESPEGATRGRDDRESKASET
jgi:phosphate:Na+ symporter